MLSNDTEAKALVLYKHKQTNRIDLTCHDVVNTKIPGEFVLGAGRAFSYKTAKPWSTFCSTLKTVLSSSTRGFS